ncbi:hypothetical protein M3Y99_00656700 [Aphelenchoides fujianensis]|nr:hypothetical protein M3Y99_00656700 [Aphelenchoides fujianensis]
MLRFLLLTELLISLFTLTNASLNCHYCSDRKAGQQMQIPPGVVTMPACKQPSEEPVNGTCLNGYFCYKEVYENGDVERGCGQTTFAPGRCFTVQNDEKARACVCNNDYCNGAHRNVHSAIVGIFLFVLYFQ